MRVDISSFRGETPRLTPRALPLNGAQIAKNARLQSGDLEAWRQFALTKNLANPGDVETIYLLNGEWLSWEVDVDVARGIIPGDNTFRIYLTGPDLYDQPRWTNFALATTGAEPFPVETRPLGVPNPDVQPTLVAGISTAPTSTTIEVVDDGDQLAESWTTSSPVNTTFTRSIVSQSAIVGNGPPSYELQFQENVNQPAYLFRDFGVGDSQVVEFSCDVLFNATARKRMFIDLLASSTGGGIGVVWTESGGFQIGIMGSFSAQGFSSLAGVVPGAPAPNIWYTVGVQIIRNTVGTKTVTATLYLGSVQITTVTVTNAFVNSGGNFGFVAELSEVTVPDAETYYDNIVVRGTSPTDPVTQIATSYVYTFVNDIGEESGPSPASATILKDDGTSITVTTPTTVQSGFSADYNVETKRIYRAVTGNTGTAFLFVAEIPLSQADYVDELTDSELGDPLESEDWDLPPDDMKGIIALPNGIMAGFRRNQLCLSAQNRPHAWPVRYRLNTDTDIVAIGNIDNTVVLGTQAFPYVATGNDPSAYSMSKLEVPQACVSKRSLAYLTSIGVVFASPDGLIAISGNGRVSNLTESIFTRKQWQALGPETILGIAHDDVYYFFNNGSAPSTFLETFEDGLDAYEAVSGNTALYSIVASGPGFGNALNAAVQTIATPANIRRTLATPVEDAVRVSARFRALSLGNDDACSVVFESVGPTTEFVIIPIREAALDPLRRVQVTFGVDVVFLGSGMITLGDSYEVEIRIAIGAGNSICGLTNRTTAALVATATFPSAHTPFDLTSVLFAIDSAPSQTCVTQYDNVEVDGAQIVALGGYALDMKPTGFGLVELSAHAIAAHADPLTDQLYLVLDAIDEPTAPYLLEPSTAPVLGLVFNDIYAFDSPDGDGNVVYQWKGKLNRLPHPAAFMYCQVKADDFDNVVLNLYADGDIFFTLAVVSADPFTLPMTDRYETFEIEIIGTSRIESVRVGETIEELMQEG